MSALKYQISDCMYKFHGTNFKGTYICEKYFQENFVNRSRQAQGFVKMIQL